MELTEKQELFVQEYLLDFNATRAAIAAGYSAGTGNASAATMGWELLRNPEIQLRISEVRKLMEKGFNITRERIALELARIAFHDPKKLFNEDGTLKKITELDDADAAVIASVKHTVTDYPNGSQATKHEIRQWEKTKALEQLARLMGYNEPDKLLLHGVKINVTEPDSE